MSAPETWEANARAVLALQGMAEQEGGEFAKGGWRARIERSLPVLPPCGFGPERQCYQISYWRT